MVSMRSLIMDRCTSTSLHFKWICGPAQEPWCVDGLLCLSLFKALSQPGAGLAPPPGWGCRSWRHLGIFTLALASFYQTLRGTIAFMYHWDFCTGILTVTIFLISATLKCGKNWHLTSVEIWVWLWKCHIMGGSQQKFLSFLLPTRQSPSHLYDYSGIEDGGVLVGNDAPENHS